MSVAAVMLVKDEADIVGFTIRNLFEQGVDRVYVQDNLSGDGTFETLNLLQSEVGFDRMVVGTDDDPAYWQSKKTTRLARLAEEDGFDWVIPCDADEWWYSLDGRSVAATLHGQTPDVFVVKADLFNHFPTDQDEPHVNPYRQIGWRHVEHQALPKVALRARRDAVIDPGNHSAHYLRSGRFLTVGGLCIAHLSWRSPAQYVKKIRNGEAAYLLTDLPENIGHHWRKWADASDDDIRAHFEEIFVMHNPGADETLVYDPAYDNHRHVA